MQMQAYISRKLAFAKSQNIRSTNVILETDNMLASSSTGKFYAMERMPEDFNSISVAIQNLGLKGYVPSDSSLTKDYCCVTAVEELSQRDICGLGRGPRGIGCDPGLDKALFRADAQELTLGVDILHQRGQRRPAVVSF